MADQPQNHNEERGVPLREYIDMLDRANSRAVEIASIEREKTAEARRVDHTDSNAVPIRQHISELEDERTRATDLASEEREKTAQALATNLARAIEEGDERLREHIASQYRQIQDALESAEKLEVARIAAVLERTNLISESSAEAIRKAEASTERRFEGVNEFRAQLAEQATKFMPRETADTRFAALQDALDQRAGTNAAKIETLQQRLDQTLPALHTVETTAERVAELNKRFDQSVGHLAGVKGTIAAAAAGLTIVIAIVIFLANILTAH